MVDFVAVEVERSIDSIIKRIETPSDLVVLFDQIRDAFYAKWEHSKNTPENWAAMRQEVQNINDHIASILGKRRVPGWVTMTRVAATYRLDLK